MYGNSRSMAVKLLLAISAIGALVAFTTGFLVSCTNEDIGSTDAIQRKQTETLTAEAQRQVGMPQIVNFQERKWAKMIFELRDREDLICHAYLYNAMEGKIGQYLGRCLGFGLPYSVQFTNPERPESFDVRGNTSDAAVVLPQPDPNGLFMPEGLSATFILLLDENGEPRPVYVEPKIIVSPFPLHGD